MEGQTDGVTWRYCESDHLEMKRVSVTRARDGVNTPWIHLLLNTSSPVLSLVEGLLSSRPSSLAASTSEQTSRSSLADPCSSDT